MRENRERKQKRRNENFNHVTKLFTLSFLTAWPIEKATAIIKWHKARKNALSLFL